MLDHRYAAGRGGEFLEKEMLVYEQVHDSAIQPHRRRGHLVGDVPDDAGEQVGEEGLLQQHLDDASRDFFVDILQTGLLPSLRFSPVHPENRPYIPFRTLPASRLSRSISLTSSDPCLVRSM